MSKQSHNEWPKLPAVADWRDTLNTVHLWSQIVGKVRLAHMPWINHSWHTTLYVSARGLTTSLIPHSSGGFEIEFNFVEHFLEIREISGEKIHFALQPMAVADFYQNVMDGLKELSISTHIYPRPVEIPDPIMPFPKDRTHASYEETPVHLFWLALVNVSRVFSRFRANFTGKVSPVHFFWGAFDLAVTRFSGRRAPKHPGGVPNCADWVMQEAYSGELSSAGFWPGTGVGEAAFYSYAYPEPEGFRAKKVAPKSAYYHEGLGEFILPYEKVRKSSDPDAMLLQFLESTYRAAAEKGKWDRNTLESNFVYQKAEG